MKNVLAAVAALTTVLLPATAHADPAGPRCDIGGTLVTTSACAFGHPSLTGLSVTASATGLPGATAVHIAIRELSATTGIGAVVLECSDASDGIADTTAGCSASLAYQGAGSFVCTMDASGVEYRGTCASTVSG